MRIQELVEEYKSKQEMIYDWVHYRGKTAAQAAAA